MTVILDCGGRPLDLRRPQIMGVLNITPDSFSDGGRLYADGVDLDAVLHVASGMIESGAAVLDVGGESTRPGADPVPEQEELDRVLPVVEVLARETGAVISVDTSTPRVMREAAAAGASMLNDVRALTRPGALEVAAEVDLPVCLMHMQGSPRTMQTAPHYANVIKEVRAYLLARRTACEDAGISAERILFDPGFGFGKSLEHNLALLAHLSELTVLGSPLLVGLSRKSLIAKLTGRAVDKRLPGSLALAMLAAQRGAALLRVHDVGETADVLRILEAVEGAENS
ncbi:MAG: dihydropteroate synthase [Pseudomonadota bacterium]